MPFMSVCSDFFLSFFFFWGGGSCLTFAHKMKLALHTLGPLTTGLKPTSTNIGTIGVLNFSFSLDTKLKINKSQRNFIS